jgi:hypothetical protein
MLQHALRASPLRRTFSTPTPPSPGPAPKRPKTLPKVHVSDVQLPAYEAGKGERASEAAPLISADGTATGLGASAAAYEPGKPGFFSDMGSSGLIQ